MIKGVWPTVALLALIVGASQYISRVENEYKRPFWASQLESCREVSRVAAKIASGASTKPIPQESIDALFNLYFGEALLFLDNITISSLGDIGAHAVKCNAGVGNMDICIRPVFNGKSMAVATACRDMLSTSWDIPLEGLDSSVLNTVFAE